MEKSVVSRLAPKLFNQALFDIHTVEGKGYVIEYDGTLSITISSFVEQSFMHGAVLGDFFSSLVVIPGGIQGGSVPIKAKATGRTIGYLFSVEALSDTNAEFNTYEAGYAKAAIEHVLFDGIGHKAVEISEDRISEQELSFDDLFVSDQLEGGEKAIAVTSLALCPDSQSVLISLARHGARFYELDDVHYGPDLFPEIQSLSIKEIPQHLGEKRSSIFFLLHMAGEQPDPFSKFISLYQIIEILISFIFKSELDEFVKHASDFDAWTSKEKLQELTGEKNRIKTLYSRYFDRSHIESNEFSECARLSKEFIQEFIEKDFSKADWPSCIYKVRNCIVHDRASLVIRQEKDPRIISGMNEIASYFLKCCVSLLYGLRKEAKKDESL